MPLIWGVLIFAACLLPVLHTNRITMGLESRSELEILGRGSFCGLMASVVWACLYYANLFLSEFELGIYLGTIGLAMSLGLTFVAAVNERFLRENLVAMGWLTAAVGSAFFVGSHQLLGRVMITLGVSLVLAVTLATGRFVLHRRRSGRQEISRENEPVQFWIIVSVLVVIIFSGFIIPHRGQTRLQTSHSFVVQPR